MTTMLPGFGPFLALLPHQFGFVPERSVVIALMRGPQVCALLRLDEDCLALPASDLLWLHESLSPVVAREKADSLVTVAFRLDPVQPELDVFNAWLEEHFVPLQHSFVVCGDVWWAIQCRPGCCDGALHSLDEGGNDAFVQALGLPDIPAASRDAAMENLFAVDQDQALLVAQRAQGKRHEPPARYTCAWARLLSGGDIDIEDVALVVAGCEWPNIRDRYLASIIPDMLHGTALFGEAPQGRSGDSAPPRASEVESVLLRQLPIIPSATRPYWLSLIAMARWRQGDQCGAGLAAEAAARDGGSCPLLSIVQRILAVGMPYSGLPFHSNGKSPAA